MAAQRSYYDILGVPKTASLDDIKKRYRELARQYHPDVNRDMAGAGKLFSEITTAYKALSDPDTRAAYDADMALRERRAAAGAARAASNGFPGSATAAPPRSGPGRPARPAPGGTRPVPPNGADTARLVAEAQAAFVRGKFVEARALCEQVLRRDRRNATAYEVLGDVYRLQGRTDDAINMYTMALQLNPRNQTVMQRLERLARAAGPSADRVFFDNRGAGGGTRPGPYSGAEALPRERRPLGTLLGGAIGYGLTLLMLLYIALFPKLPIGNMPEFFGWVNTWSVSLIVVMALAGLVLGFTLAATAAIRRIDDELILPGARSSQGSHLPLGLILIVVSILSFYAAALLYGIIGFIQESLTPSMVRVFGAVMTVVLLLTVFYSPGPGQVFLFGGNVVFLALLIGWALGDFFRPDGL